MTADSARAILRFTTNWIEQEARGTRQVIARVPNDRRDYRPDAKSRTAWELATHLVLSDLWFAESILNGAFVWTGEGALPAGVTDPASLAAWHERALADALTRLRAMTDEQLLREVDFFGYKGPAVTWLGMMNNHAVHHRGQLTTYLRASGSTVPAIYGMSADEQPA